VKLLDRFPRPLLADIRSGAWVPIVGAGLSRNAILPNGGSMPTWKELGALPAADVTGIHLGWRRSRRDLGVRSRAWEEPTAIHAL